MLLVLERIRLLFLVRHLASGAKQSEKEGRDARERESVSVSVCGWEVGDVYDRTHRALRR